MKHIKYIAILIVSLFVSCTENDIVPNNHPNVVGKNQIQLVTRIAPFTEHDVTSRAVGDNQSVQYDFIIFGTDNTCVYYNHCYNEIINIDRANDFPGINQDLLNSCTIYVLTNYSGIYEKICQDAQDADYTDVTKYITDSIVGVKDIDYFAVIPTAVLPDVNLDESALPRIGSITGIDLSLDADIDAGTIYTVDLQSLFSKMVFDIKVDPTETNAEIFNSNTFQLLGYTVSNLPKSVDLFSGEVGNTHDNLEIYDKAVEGVLGDDVNLQPATELSFTLYLPERFFKPSTSADNFIYPFGQGDAIREEDKNLRQRYKPLLAKGYSSFNGSPGTDNKATYVTISGVFTNHQGHTFDVKYDVYVGKDNYGNFDVVRNMQYNNTLTIKGIHNSSNQNDPTVSVDHRVNVTHTRPILVSLRRETLLDAHFEVRPLRIRRNPAYVGETINHVKVEVVYSDVNNKPEADGSGNWISLERSFGDGKAVNTSSLYCVSGSSAGKRKYFTYDLVNKAFSKDDNATDEYKPLHASTELIFPMSDASPQECVWIYVDECTEASRAKDAKRSATIKVTCGKKEGDNFIPVGESLDFIINQHKLFEIQVDDRIYHIEHEEEYLYNFDNEDTHKDNQTTQEGIEWGLYNAQLSFDHKALYVEGGLLGAMTDYINNQITAAGIAPYYDFYIPKHDTDVNDALKKRGYRGWVFCDEIIKDVNANDAGRNTGYSGRIGALTMADMPRFALEYAYNRNKRNRDGSIASLDWYLPAIDEMEDIMVGGSLYFEDFHLDRYYWSCQPSYLPNYAYHRYTLIVVPITRTGTYYVDDTGKYDDSDTQKSVWHNNGFARATKAVHQGNNNYTFMPSGTKGFDNAITIEGANPRNGSFSITYNGTAHGKTLENWETPEMESIGRQEGNFERNTKHRVRCVRKSSYTKTNAE